MINMERIKEGILSGAIKMDQLTAALEKLRLHAYSTLIEIQRDLIGVHKYHISYSDLDKRPDTSFSGVRIRSMYQYNVKMSFVHHTKRLRFRRSSVYNVPLTYQDIKKYPDIFVYNYFVLIDGHIDLSAKVVCKEEITSINLNPKAMDPKLAKLFKEGCSIDIVILPSLSIETLTATRRDIVNHVWTIAPSQPVNEHTRVLAFISSESTLPKMYLAKVLATGEFRILPESLGDIGFDEEVTIVAVIMPNLLESHEVDHAITAICTKTMPMPIPENNILVWVKHEDESVTLDTGFKITKKYGSMFLLEDHEDITCDVFYWDRPNNSNMQYMPEYWMYDRFVDINAAYLNGTQNPILENFSPIQYTYNVSDFHKEGHSDRRGNELIYKVNKMYDTFKLWALASQLYYENIAEYYNGYIIDTSKLNMEEKYRTNSNQDVGFIEDHDLGEGCYVFIFSNKAKWTKLPYKFWVDGLRVCPKHVAFDHSYEYVYLPATAFNSAGSKVEIERSNAITGVITLTTSEEGTSFSLLNFDAVNHSIPVNSLFVTDEEGMILDHSTYHFTVEIGADECTLDSESTLWLTSGSVLKLYVYDTATYPKVNVRYYDRPIEVHHVISGDNFGDNDLNSIGDIRGIPRYKNRIRIFHDGKLVPKSKYRIYDTGNVFNPWEISLEGDTLLGDFITDYIPEGYEEIYYQENIGAKGIVDLTGKIDKPFSMKYFDVYLNGYRLLPEQVENITYFIIQIKDVKTIDNLYIYERKSTMAGFYTLDVEDSKRFLAEQLYEKDEEFVEKLRDHIINIMPNEDIPDVDIYCNFFDLLTYELAKYIEPTGVLLADDEIDQDIREIFAKFLDDGGVTFLDANQLYETAEKGGFINFLAPEKITEQPHINNPWYMKDYNRMMGSIQKGAIREGTEEEIATTYPVMTLSSSVTLGHGNQAYTRWPVLSSLPDVINSGTHDGKAFVGVLANKTSMVNHFFGLSEHVTLDAEKKLVTFYSKKQPLVHIPFYGLIGTIGLEAEEPTDERVAEILLASQSLICKSDWVEMEEPDEEGNTMKASIQVREISDVPAERIQETIEKGISFRIQTKNFFFNPNAQRVFPLPSL